MPAFNKGYTSSCRLAIPVSAYQSVQAADWGVVQPAIPTPGASNVLWYAYVSTAFKVYKPVQTIYPQQGVETPGVVVGPWQCIAPDYPGTSTVVAAGTYFFNQQFLYYTSGGGTTGSSFPVLNATAGASTTDNSVTWVCKGRQSLIVAQVFAITSGSPPSGPIAQEVDFYQL